MTHRPIGIHPLLLATTALACLSVAGHAVAQTAPAALPSVEELLRRMEQLQRQVTEVDQLRRRVEELEAAQRPSSTAARGRTCPAAPHAGAAAAADPRPGV